MVKQRGELVDNSRACKVGDASKGVVFKDYEVVAA